MSHHISIPFDLTGEFIGFRFTEAGKRRLLLLVGGEARLFKVPRPLRRRMIGFYRPGQTIRVVGVEERDPAGEHPGKWVVSDVRSPNGEQALAPAVPQGAIRVCAKKNCWRSGGRELMAALERELETRGLDDQIYVKAVGCLDRCNHAPNVDWGSREFSRCHLDDFTALLDQAAAKTPAASA